MCMCILCRPTPVSPSYNYADDLLAACRWANSKYGSNIGEIVQDAYTWEQERYGKVMTRERDENIIQLIQAHDIERIAQLKEEVAQASIEWYFAMDKEEYNDAKERWRKATLKLIAAMEEKQ